MCRILKEDSLRGYSTRIAEKAERKIYIGWEYIIEQPLVKSLKLKEALSIHRPKDLKIMQATLFNVKLAKLEPFVGTADLKVIGYTSTFEKYAVKREQDGVKLPIAEWIGHSLCSLCDIPTPFFTVVECPETEELAFGSRWEESSTQINDQMAGVDQLSMLAKHGSQISGIHAIDLFSANEDRHAGNFLFVNRANTDVCLAMDFSKSAMRVEDPFGRCPIPASCHTMVIKNILDSRGLFIQSDYDSSHRKLSQLNDDIFMKILDRAPNEWYKNIGKMEIMDWWKSERTNRLKKIK